VEPSQTNAFPVRDQIFTLANCVSFARLLGVPLFLYLFLVADATVAAVAVLMVGGTTDWIDGWLARRMRQVSKLGELLDPFADRLYIAATVVAFTVRGVLPWWFTGARPGQDGDVPAAVGVPAAAARRCGAGHLGRVARGRVGARVVGHRPVLGRRRVLPLPGVRPGEAPRGRDVSTPPTRPPVSTDLLTDLFRNPLDPGYEAAARRREEHGPAPAWARRGGRTVRTVVLVLVGFLLVVAYQQVVASEPQTTRARDDLAKEVADRRREADGLGRDAERMRADVNRRRDAALAADPELARLRDLEARAGLTRMTGDGVVVKLAPAAQKRDPVTGQVAADDPGRVLDRDLQEIANALWNLDAEAIAINGQRLTTTSTIRSAGGAILVDFRPITPPYEVSAIGPGDLDKKLSGSSTGKRFQRFAGLYGMQFEVRARDGLVLPAGADAGLRYARPPQPSGSAAPSASSPSTSPSRSGGR
jgi:uncharacterized protein YlxW (UPF0749 family)